jgi:proteasome lid subunit RPN8/RPN11
MNLKLAPGLLEKVVEHAKTCHPQEGCGLIVGPSRGSLPQREVLGSRFVPMHNALASATAFEMDPGQLVSTLREMRNAGEELVAIYHSHPHGPAYPSQTDIERAYYPEAAHLIVSLAEPERPRTAAFRIFEGEVIEIPVHVIV